MRLKLYRGTWCIVWRDANGTRRQSLHTADRAVAERQFADTQQADRRAAQTVAGIYRAYLADKGTERAVWAWRQLDGPFGNLRPDQVTRHACRRYAEARRAGGAGTGTVHTELTYLRAALRWHDPHTKAVVQLPPKPPPRDRVLTRPQFDALMAAIKPPHLQLFTVLALTTAGRATAILELTWDRVDFERDLITLGDGTQRRKGRATVPMNPRSRPALLAAYATRSCPYVIEYDSGRVLRIVKGFKTAARTAGMEWCTPHVLRHTAAVWMAEAGVPMAKIAQVLGHTDSRITERVYARFSPDYLRTAVGSL